MKPALVDSHAEEELSASIAFYEEKVPGLGMEFERAAREAVEAIQAHPERQPLQDGGTRRMVLSRFPFVIHYMECLRSSGFSPSRIPSRKPGYWRRRS